MGTNPFTDRYLADAANDAYRHDDCPPGGCTVEKREARWKNNFLSTLPDIDDATIGKVLLHLGAGISDVMSQQAVLALPDLVPAYMKNLLQNTGADLINHNAGTEAANQTSTAKPGGPTVTNPTTNKYIADVVARDKGHANCKSPCPQQVNEDEWRKSLMAELPDVDAAVAGQVMLHIGMRLANLEIGLLLIGAHPQMLTQYIASTMQYVGADLVTARQSSDTPKAGG